VAAEEPRAIKRRPSSLILTSPLSQKTLTTDILLTGAPPYGIDPYQRDDKASSSGFWFGEGRRIRHKSEASMKRKEYEEKLRPLQVELCRLQDWVKLNGLRVVVVFEGRDAAGKGGTIKAITERVSPRVFRVVALPAPSDREKSQMYIQRYLPHFPAAGELVIFDRSWYNRAGVERVMGFCTEKQTRAFLELVPFAERVMVEGGLILIKYWLEVGKEEQARRFDARINDPVRQWKLSRGISSARTTRNPPGSTASRTS
jgi:polyphosphate kinase 2